jgi:hypothetical protein
MPVGWSSGALSCLGIGVRGPPKSARNARVSTCRGHAIRAGFPAPWTRDLDTCPHPPLRLGENQTATCAFSPIAGVDGFGCDPYTPVHRRAANGVGGLLLHLLTIGGVWAWGSGRALLFCCVWVLFFDK